MKWKVRTGTVDRISDGESGSGGSVTVIGKGLFKKETDLSLFVRMPISLANGAVRPLRHSHARCDGNSVLAVFVVLVLVLFVLVVVVVVVVVVMRMDGATEQLSCMREFVHGLVCGLLLPGGRC